MDPPEFNFENLGDILGSLSSEDFEKISSLAQQFSMNSDSEERSESQQEHKNNGSGFSIDPEMLFKLMSIFEKLQNQQNDPRCNLIYALKPLLSPARRQKADKAIELLRLMSLLSVKDIFGME